MIDEIYVLVRWNVDFTKDAASNSKYHQRIRDMRATKEWEKRRIAVWKRYTMPSLLRQTYQNFRVILLCDGSKRDEWDNLIETLPQDRNIFGLLGTEHWNEWREMLLDNGDEYDRIMFCRLDSDDMYHFTAINKFVVAVREKDRKGKTHIQAMKGYGYDLVSRTVHRWANPSPPFFCVVVDRRDLEKDLSGSMGIAHHGKLGRRAYRIQDEALFCVTINGTNICNRSSVPWKKERIEGSELDLVRKDYGLNADDIAV